MFKRNEVRDAVMATVEKRIEIADSNFKTKAKQIASETFQAILAIKKTSEERRAQALKEAVDSVLN